MTVDAVNWAIAALPIFGLPSSEGNMGQPCLGKTGFLNPAIHPSPSSYMGTCRLDWSLPFSGKVSSGLPAMNYVSHTLSKRPDMLRF